MAQGPRACDRGHGFRCRDAPPWHPARRPVQLGQGGASDLAGDRRGDHLGGGMLPLEPITSLITEAIPVMVLSHVNFAARAWAALASLVRRARSSIAVSSTCATCAASAAGW